MGDSNTEAAGAKAKAWPASACMMSLASGLVETDPSAGEKIEAPKTWPYMTYGSIAKSVALKLATVSLIWGMGYMNWSLAWLVAPIAYVVLKGERKKDGELKRLTAQATALSKEKLIIESRIDELPTWVYFPDYDRAEWLNQMLYKMWPSVNHYARDLCKTVIQQKITECLADYEVKFPGMGKEFCFDRIVLGRIPPKINGVKAYDKNTSRNEVVLDMDVMYAGDCDVTFTMGTYKAGIKDFQLRGMLRVTLKPLIPVVPIVGGVQVFFLNCPTVDFNLVGIADVLDLPGFSDVLRKIICQQIAALAVLPNKFSVPLAAEVSAESLKTPEPEGVLRIHVVQAKHLMKKDIGMLGKGKSDPYAVVTVGAQEFRTKTIDNSVDPKWDFWCECVMETNSDPGNMLEAHLFDQDATGSDDSLGRATIEVSRVKRKGTIDKWISLELAKHGMVHLHLVWLQLSNSANDLKAALKETQELRVTSMSTAVLILYVDSAKNLPCLKGNKQPDVYLEASVGGKVERTGTIFRSSNPVWEQGFTMLVGNPETGILHVKIVDFKSATQIGTFNYNLSNLLAMADLEMKLQPFDLQKSGSESKVSLSMKLRVLKYEEPEFTSDNEEDEDIQSLNKKIERQESSVSSIVSDVSLKRQASKDSMRSNVSNVTNPKLIAEHDDAEEQKNGTVAPTSVIPQYSSIREDSPGLIRRNPSVTSYSGSSKLGRIQLTLKYSVQRQKLIVVVHKVANLPLPANDSSNIPDPYVKLYLLPDKHKETKRKTAVMKDNCNPIFDEEFEYLVSQGDVNSRVLELAVCTQKGWLSTGSNCMGQVLIKLSEIDFSQSLTSWYDLQPESKD